MNRVVTLLADGVEIARAAGVACPVVTLILPAFFPLP
jgi:hypothetical protein